MLVLMFSCPASTVKSSEVPEFVWFSSLARTTQESDPGDRLGAVLPSPRPDLAHMVWFSEDSLLVPSQLNTPKNLQSSQGTKVPQNQTPNISPEQQQLFSWYYVNSNIGRKHASQEDYSFLSSLR